MGLPGFDEDGEREFAAGSVFGYRTWNVDARSGLLRGMYSQVWTAREMEARCLAAPSYYWASSNSTMSTTITSSTPFSTFPHSALWDASPHEAPAAGCGCGFWAYWAPDGAGSGTVHGVVEGFGRTLIGERGLRCRKARIVALWAPPAESVWASYTAAGVYFAEAVGEAPPDIEILGLRYGVPVYRAQEEMLAAHPLTDARAYRAEAARLRERRMGELEDDPVRKIMSYIPAGTTLDQLQGQLRDHQGRLRAWAALPPPQTAAEPGGLAALLRRARSGGLRTSGGDPDGPCVMAPPPR